MRRTGNAWPHALLAACGGFLIAVLWFDLMFDVQVAGHAGVLPDAVRASIAGYYRRVTTDAHPMQRLIGVVMGIATLGSLAVLRHGAHRRLHAVAAALAWSAVGLAGGRVFPNAARLGTLADDPATQSALARGIYADHLACLGAMLVFTAMQIALAARESRTPPPPGSP